MFGKNAYDFCFKDIFTLVSGKYSVNFESRDKALIRCATEEKTDVKQGSELKQANVSNSASSNGKSNKKSTKKVSNHVLTMIRCQ